MQARVFTAIMVALAFAFAPVLEAAPRPDGGPTKLATSTSVNANSEAGGQFGMPDDILPIASTNFAPVGLAFGQMARVNLVNMDVPNGISVSCRFIDAGGATLAQSVITLSLGKIPRLRNNRAAMHHVFHVGKERTGCREAVRPFASGFYSAQISKRAV
jgi:hypothetical protein